MTTADTCRPDRDRDGRRLRDRVDHRSAAGAAGCEGGGLRPDAVGREVPDLPRRRCHGHRVGEQRCTAVVSMFGGIDILVNNAGIGATGTVADNDLQEWRRVFDVNVFGIVRTTAAALPHLRASGRRRGQRLLDRRHRGSAAARGVLGLQGRGALAHPGDGRGSHPGWYPGECGQPRNRRHSLGRSVAQYAADPDAERAALNARQPHGRLVSSEEIASAIAYLASPAAASTVGVVLPVDGGMAGFRLPPPGR